MQNMDQGISFISLYGPNKDQPILFLECFANLDNIEMDHMILGGDMNFVVDDDFDLLNYVRKNNVNAKRTFF